MLHWLIDKSIQMDSPFVNWKAAEEYLTWMKLSKAGKTLKELRARFERIAGLSMTVQRTDSSDVGNFSDADYKGVASPGDPGCLLMFHWVVLLMGGEFAVRFWHHLFLWFFVAFTIVHVYLAFYHDYIEGRGTISSIVGGSKFDRERDK